MSDRELMVKAARAAGIEVNRGHGWQSDRLFRPSVGDGTITGVEWNPLTDDGDALRLAVKLRIDICRPDAASDFVCVWDDAAGDFIQEPHGDDPYAATRRAIVRAAAAMAGE